MKKIIYFLCCSCLLSTIGWAQSAPLIPRPLQSQKLAGQFQLNAKTPVVVEDEDFADAAQFLRQSVLSQFRLPLPLLKGNVQSAILFMRDAAVKNPEGYQLDINPQHVTIRASAAPGAFYGAVSLLQLMHHYRSANGISLAAWHIADQPRYPWRGVMLDESRHFFGKQTVKTLLDWMAFYKLNIFHWHLTDEPGWRLEIKKYPRLTLVGGIGNFTDSLAPARYYTQEDINEILAYAAVRQIRVIPEIDMPGHATAANRAYPAFSGGGSAKHPEFTFNPGKEGTYQYLTDILREVNVLFPSSMIHLGGDEVSYGNEKWQTDPDIRRLMDRQGLADIAAVERYFMERMADSVYSLNARVLAWDEVAGMDLDPEKTLVLWWRHDRPGQLKKLLDRHFPVVLCPRLPLYFDFVQDSTDRLGRKWGKQFNPLQAVYQFNADSLTGAAASTSNPLVRGIQANLWTETVQDQRRLYYMLFPRIAALAENAWTAPSKRDYKHFEQALKRHYPLYQKAGIYYYKPGRPEAINN